MLRTDFPDLDYLKKRITLASSEGKGWPNVILNVRSLETHRPDIRGPLSIFMNLSGSSHCSVGKHAVRIEDDMYFITNRHEHYSLDIENPKGTETFNIHFGEQLMEDVFTGLTKSGSKLLDEPFVRGEAINFFSKLYPRDDTFNSLVKNISDNREEFNNSKLLQDEMLSRLLVHLLHAHKEIHRDIARLPPVKRATREEAYRRLILSVDYICSYYSRNISLEELAGLSCLSRFHYLRMFKAAFGTTPYHFLNEVRMKKAKSLLEKTNITVADISVHVGFENVSSFCRAFYRTVHQWPQQYREARLKNSNFGKHASFTPA